MAHIPAIYLHILHITCDIKKRLTAAASALRLGARGAAPARCSERDKWGQHSWGHCKLSIFITFAAAPLVLTPFVRNQGATPHGAGGGPRGSSELRRLIIMIMMIMIKNVNANKS